MLIYNNLMSKWDRTAEMLAEVGLVPLPRLVGTPECKLYAQILHVNRGGQIDGVSRTGVDSKKVTTIFDRLIFLRDLETGLPFIVPTQSIVESLVLFFKKVKMGDYVILFNPLATTITVGNIPLVEYTDVLMPLEGVPGKNVMVDFVPRGIKFAVFAVSLEPWDLQLHNLGVVRSCEGSLCDGTVQGPCPCLEGKGSETHVLHFRIPAPVGGLVEKFLSYQSVSMTQKFFGPNVIRQLCLYKRSQLQEVVEEALLHAEQLVIAGWVGHDFDCEEIGMNSSAHITSLKVEFARDEDGNPLFVPNDDLQIPPLPSNN